MTDHPDYRTLLDAVLADPYDDAPRLILAEWLEEHTREVECSRCQVDTPGWRLGLFGEPPRVKCHVCHGTGRVSNGYAERAEFIRVQIELARLRPKTGWAFLRDGTSDDAAHHAERYDTDPRIEALERREKKLFTVLPAFATAGIIGRIERGFVSSVYCTLAEWYGGKQIVGRGPAIVAEHPITRVDVSDRHPSARDALSLALVNWAREQAGLPELRSEHAEASNAMRS